MESMEAAAAHDILVISDSDVRVTPDYLRAVALPFADEKVGAMHVSLSRGGGGGRLVGTARGRGHERGDDGRGAGGADDGGDAVCAGADDGVSARSIRRMGGLRGDGGLLRR